METKLKALVQKLADIHAKVHMICGNRCVPVEAAATAATAVAVATAGVVVVVVMGTRIEAQVYAPHAGRNTGAVFLAWSPRALLSLFDSCFVTHLFVNIALVAPAPPP